MAAITKALRVLVVDDERTVCNGVEKVLLRRGHAVVKALTVVDAMVALEADAAFDLVIADLMMPQAGGIDLLRVVRDRFARVPVVIMTGYASIASAVEAAQIGAAGYLPKPFTPDELTLTVGHALASARPVIAPKIVVRTKTMIDVDMPFDEQEVAAATSADDVKLLGRGDMPGPDFCDQGHRACKRFQSKGTCTRPECPQVLSERTKNIASAVVLIADPIDVDMPFSAREGAFATSDAFVDALSRGDAPVTGHWNPAQSSKPRVLVVDDEAVVANSIRRSLSRRGYDVQEAVSGSEALNRILTETYDLVLLDVRMPDGSGLDLLPTIRRHRPKLPVVMVTGYASIDNAVEAIQLGATDYMAKPFTPEEIYQKAGLAIRRSMV